MPDEIDNPHAQSLVRKLSTILSADVAEFSRLMGEDEEQTLRTFRGHKQVFESLVSMHRGRIFNTAGDAILAEFASAVEAVRCATDIQSALRTRNDQLPPSRQVRFRIGINLGDVMVQDQDLLGDGVNVAARLQTAAEPGGICISGSVYDQIRNKLSLSFQSLGEKSFKNIQQPVRTFSIAEEGREAVPSAPPPAPKSGSGKWIAAAVLLLLAGGGYWTYAVKERSKADHTSAQAAAVQPVVASPEPAQPKIAKAAPPETKTSEASPSVAKPRVEKAVERESKSTDAPRKPALHEPAPQPAASFDGVYSGPVCYAETKTEPARCYRAEGTIKGDKITGEWMMGRENKLAMLLVGDVASSGEVKINMEMHGTEPDAAPLAVIDLTGTVHDGRINASGTFRRGRGATLNWHRDSGDAH
jgi:class 3 adenylate cyclase